MKKKFQYGRDLYSLLSDGMVFTIVSSMIQELMSPIEQSLMLHNLLETSPLKDLKDSKNKLNKNLKRLKGVLTPRIKEINSKIQILNSEIKGLDFKYQIPELKLKEILQNYVESLLKWCFIL